MSAGIGCPLAESEEQFRDEHLQVTSRVVGLSCNWSGREGLEEGVRTRGEDGENRSSVGRMV